jgi:hypothetical protein
MCIDSIDEGKKDRETPIFFLFKRINKHDIIMLFIAFFQFISDLANLLSDDMMSHEALMPHVVLCCQASTQPLP